MRLILLSWMGTYIGWTGLSVLIWAVYSAPMKDGCDE
jgi:hypothetical protein